MGISREAQDDYGIESYKRTEAAIKNGVFDNEIVGVDVGKNVVISEDEEVGRCDYNTFRTTRTYWGETVGVGSSSKVNGKEVLIHILLESPFTLVGRWSCSQFAV